MWRISDMWRILDFLLYLYQSTLVSSGINRWEKPAETGCHLIVNSYWIFQMFTCFVLNTKNYDFDVNISELFLEDLFFFSQQNGLKKDFIKS